MQSISQQKTAVVLFQLGGPDSLDAVEPFLYNLFCDPDIIDFPFAFLARKSLAKFISSRRSNTVREHYAAIGGKSPIRELTELQATALEHELRSSENISVLVAMRYWKPFTYEAIETILNGHFQRIILLPMYPQYSFTTTASSIKEWNRLVKQYALALPTATIESFYSNNLYIQSLVEKINEGLQLFGTSNEQNIHLVFSAHGIPVSLVEKGDPYQTHIEATVHSALAKGKWNVSSSICYQSKVGPAQWLKPSLRETIEKLATEDKKYILVIPISFVTDHIETLHEINIEMRQIARQCGIQQFEITSGLNTSPTFISALAQLVKEKISSFEN
jgi:ferrochelatase